SRGQRSPEPLRVVLSRQLELPANAQLWDTSGAPTLVAHGPEAPAAARARLDQLGVERLALGRCGPLALLGGLAARGCNRVLWECGPQLAATALVEGCVQQVAAVIAPKLLGGLPARTPLGELGLSAINEAQKVEQLKMELLGNDWLWTASIED
ncbi:MAG: bifunctional diaminohydroxyphosphoribosylaminopyrimidine deaminase/5-amino-6-(5-phosphoribosylamino)uracil reductase, partial [Synechococcaceae bacterium WB6_3B_236]|nr:bifunctional diaminohydroxyphosphoribosylaminopyrimidine deaminase/5-amino-6-(5-phosphoribosylamino)uracil reductase [Synechococcaceae bacterium WB6_3B_236]